MKSFQQFLDEAHSSQRDIKGSERFLRGAHGTINVSAKRRKREETERAERLSNLPAGTGTSAELARAHIAAQMAALKQPQKPTPAPIPTAAPTSTQKPKIKK